MSTENNSDVCRAGLNNTRHGRKIFSSGSRGHLTQSRRSASFGTQLLGTVSICLFTFVVSYIAWMILDMLMGAKVSEESEVEGLDKTELGIEAYPDFSK